MATVSLKKYLKLKIASTDKDVRHLREKVKDNRRSADKEAGAIAMALKKQEDDYKKQFIDINPVMIDPIRKDLNAVMQWKSNQEGKQSRIFVIAVVSGIIALMGVTVAAIALVKSFY